MKVKDDAAPPKAAEPVKAVFTQAMKRKPPAAAGPKAGHQPVPARGLGVSPGSKGVVQTRVLSAAQTVRSTARLDADNKAQSLQVVRGAHLKTESTLNAVRAQHDETAQSGQAHRLKSLIQDDLQQHFQSTPRGEHPMNQSVSVDDVKREQSSVSAPSQGSTVDSAGQKKTAAAPSDARAEAAAQLIEKIDFFVKANRPGLKLDLHQSLGGTVEINRVGKGEVAVRIASSSNALDASTIEQIRQALTERGLKLTSLTVSSTQVTE